MELHVDMIGDVSLVTVPPAHMDAGNQNEFLDEMFPVLQENSKLILDMSEIQFADSSGIGAVLRCIRQMQTSGGTMKICCLTEPVRMAFELVQMQRLVDCFDSCDGAVKAFQKAS